MSRRKLEEDRKKKKISTTIDHDLMGLYEEYLIENGISHKSKLIERKLMEVVCDGCILSELVSNGILPKKNNLI